MSLSYLEIYNENIKDLFNCESGNLELRGSGNNVQIMGLTELEVDSTQQVRHIHIYLRLSIPQPNRPIKLNVPIYLFILERPSIY